jgi:hypothetical protein
LATRSSAATTAEEEEEEEIWATVATVDRSANGRLATTTDWVRKNPQRATVMEDEEEDEEEERENRNRNP